MFPMFDTFEFGDSYKIASVGCTVSPLDILAVWKKLRRAAVDPVNAA
jgi:hypothetical protein